MLMYFRYEEGLITGCVCSVCYSSHTSCQTRGHRITVRDQQERRQKEIRMGRSAEIEKKVRIEEILKKKNE